MMTTAEGIMCVNKTLEGEGGGGFEFRVVDGGLQPKCVHIDSFTFQAKTFGYDTIRSF